MQDKVEVMRKCGDAALILYEFYINKASLDSYAFSDEDAAKALAWNIHKIAKNRRKLVDNSYFLQVSGRLTDKRKITVTYLEPKLINEIKSIIDCPELLTKLLEKDGAYVDEI